MCKRYELASHELKRALIMDVFQFFIRNGVSTNLDGMLRLANKKRGCFLCSHTDYTSLISQKSSAVDFYALESRHPLLQLDEIAPLIQQGYDPVSDVIVGISCLETYQFFLLSSDKARDLMVVVPAAVSMCANMGCKTHELVPTSQACSKCKIAYCSKYCQEQHWARHNLACSK